MNQFGAGEVSVIARTESVHQGHSMVDTNKRLEAAESAGAIAVVPHYVGQDPLEAKKILEQLTTNIPAILIPTGILTTPAVDLVQAGAAALVYANIDLRLRVGYLSELYTQLACSPALAQENSEKLVAPQKLKNLLENS